MIIAISGGKFAGKDTFYKTIKDHFSNYTFAEKKFSYNMKLCACIMFGWTMEQIEDQTFKETIDPEYGVSPRMFLDDFGTTYGRQHLCNLFPEFKKLVGERIWSKGAVRDAKAMEASNDFVFFTDFRYLVEDKELDDSNSEVIKINIERQTHPINPKSADIQVPLLKYNYKLINEGTDLNKYKKDCIDLFTTILKDYDGRF